MSKLILQLVVTLTPLYMTYSFLWFLDNYNFNPLNEVELSNYAASTREDKMTIVVFGEQGVGKSSVVNMILNEDQAPVGMSESAWPLPFTYSEYKAYRFKIYDVSGLDDSEFHVFDTWNSSFNLCHEVGRISDIFEKNYDVFVKQLSSSKVPVLLVITHAEQELDWLDDNKETFQDYGLLFIETIAICSSNGLGKRAEFQSLFLERYEESRIILENAVNKYALAQPWKRQRGSFLYDAKILKNIVEIMLNMYQIQIWKVHLLICVISTVIGLSLRFIVLYLLTVSQVNVSTEIHFQKDACTQTQFQDTCSPVDDKTLDNNSMERNLDPILQANNPEFCQKNSSITNKSTEESTSNTTGMRPRGNRVQPNTKNIVNESSKTDN